jgi:hypothetical protein
MVDGPRHGATSTRFAGRGRPSERLAKSSSRCEKDVDYFVAAEHYDEAQARLRAGEWKKTGTLTFPNAALGLHGSVWTPRDGGREIDLITSEQPWAREAFSAPISRAANGLCRNAMRRPVQNSWR